MSNSQTDLNQSQVGRSSSSEKHQHHSSHSHSHHHQERSWMDSLRDYSNVYRMFFGTNIISTAWNCMTLGMIMSPIAALIVAVLELGGILSLLRVKQHLQRKNETLVSFAAIAGRVWGNVGAWFLDILVIICQWLTCVGYLIFAAHNFEHIQEVFSYPVCVILAAIVSFLLSLLQTPLFLARISLVTNPLMMIGVIIILSQLKFGADEIPADNGEIVYFTDAMKTMIGFATLATNLGGVSVALDVERTMSHTHGRFHMILNRMLVVAVVVLVGIGLLAYSYFRENTCSVLSLSLPKGSTPRRIVEGIFSVGPLAEYVMNSFQGLLLIKDRLALYPRYFSTSGSKLQFFVLRLLWAALASIVAIYVSFYGLISALNGAISYGSLAFLIPTAMELTLLHRIRILENTGNDDNAQNDNDNDNKSLLRIVDEKQQHGYDSTAAIATDIINNDNDTTGAASSSSSKHQNRPAMPVYANNGSIVMSEDGQEIGTRQSTCVRDEGDDSSSDSDSSSGSPSDNENSGAENENEQENTRSSKKSDGAGGDEEVAALLAEHDKLTPDRTWQLYAILILGGTLVVCGVVSSVRQIYEELEGNKKTNSTCT